MNHQEDDELLRRLRMRLGTDPQVQWGEEHLSEKIFERTTRKIFQIIVKEKYFKLFTEHRVSNQILK